MGTRAECCSGNKLELPSLRYVKKKLIDKKVEITRKRIFAGRKVRFYFRIDIV